MLYNIHMWLNLRFIHQSAKTLKSLTNQVNRNVLLGNPESLRSDGCHIPSTNHSPHTPSLATARFRSLWSGLIQGDCTAAWPDWDLGNLEVRSIQVLPAHHDQYFSPPPVSGFNVLVDHFAYEFWNLCHKQRGSLKDSSSFICPSLLMSKGYFISENIGEMCLNTCHSDTVQHLFLFDWLLFPCLHCGVAPSLFVFCCSALQYRKK